MNRYMLEMIQKIFDAKHGISIKELAQEMLVSERTIRNYWEEISYFLNKNSLYEMMQFYKGVFSFSSSYHSLHSIIHALLAQNLQDYTLSADERQIFVILLLIFSESPVKLNAICTLLYSSRSTIMSDLKRIQETFQDYEITIDDKKHYGLSLNGTEFHKRRLILDSLERLGLLTSYPWTTLSSCVCGKFVSIITSLEQYQKPVSAVLIAAEKQFHLTLDDRTFYNLSLIVSLLIHRIKHHHFVQFTDTSLQEHQSFPSSFLEYLLDAKHWNVICPPAEYTYLLHICISMHLLPDYGHISPIKSSIDMAVMVFLQKLSFAYGMDLTSNHELTEHLSSHIMNTNQRLSVKKTPDISYTTKIKKMFPNDFQMIKNNIQNLEAFFQQNLSDNELAYLLMHVLPVINEKRQQNFCPKVIITCETGLITGKFLASMIAQHIPCEIIAICSTHNLSTVLKANTCDLVLSTIHLSHLSIPWLQISAIPDATDYEKIRQKLEYISHKEASTFRLSSEAKEHIFQMVSLSQKPTLLSFLSANRILLDRPAKSWQEAIYIAGEALLWDHLITIDYLNQMIYLVQKYGPYIVIAPGIALAHANPMDGVLEDGLSLLRLQSPVYFDSCPHPVSIIIASALSEKHIPILMDFMKTIYRTPLVEYLIAANTVDEILELLKKGSTSTNL